MTIMKISLIYISREAVTRLSRIIVGVFILASSGLAAYAQQQFIQTVARDNKNCNAVCSVIDIPELNGNPSAVIFVTPVGNTASLNPHPIGLYYMYLKKWSVFNLDGIAIPEGAKYSIEYYAKPDANHFTFLVREGGGTCIDRDGLNGNSSAQVRLFPASSPTRGSWYNDTAVKVEYNAKRLQWCLASIDGGGVKTDTAYNIAFTSGGVVPLVGTPTNLTSMSSIQPAATTPTGSVPLQGNLIVPTSTLAPQQLIVVARVEWAIPTVGLVVIHPEECKVIDTDYTNPAILGSDTVIVTGQASNAGLSSPAIHGGTGQNFITVVPTNDGKNLKWSATVENSLVHLTVCNDPVEYNKLSNPLSQVVYLNGRKVNILVLR